MSTPLTTACPRTAEWPALVAHRFERRGEEPAGFRERLAHLEGCPECRRAALAADPTLLFRRLASPAAETGRDLRPAEREGDLAEAEAVRRAVAAMRTGSRLAETRTSRAASWKRWAAAAALALAALSTGSRRGLRELPAPPMPISPIPPVSAAGPAPAVDFPGLADAAPGWHVPELEDFNRPDARVYRWDSPDTSVLWIVDPGLEGLDG